MRFEVPQFIEVEDKVVGPLTWKQFIFVAGGIGAGVLLFVFGGFLLFAVVGIPIVALAGFLAFHQINNRPFSIFLESVVSYFSGTKLYLWKKRDVTVVGTTPPPSYEQTTTPSVPTSKEGISSLSRKLELNALQQEQP